jgi:hypothetical protein
LLEDLAFVEKLGLHDGSLNRLLLSFFYNCFHPVVVVTNGLEVQVLKFFSDITPNLSVFEVGVELDALHVLFFFEVKFMEVESYSVECSEDDHAQVVLFNIIEQ